MCVCWGKGQVVDPLCMFFVSVQNAGSAFQAVPEATFTQEAPLRLQPQDRGRPPADGEEVAHCQVTMKTPSKHLSVVSGH